MKHLWIKIFYVVLIAILFFMSIVIVVWQKDMISYMFEREEQEAVKNQKYICAALMDAVSFSSLSEGVQTLSDEALKETILNSLNYNIEESSLFEGEKMICSTYGDSYQEEKVFLDMEIEAEECYVSFQKNTNKNHIKIVSLVTIQGQEYRLICVRDISKIYAYEKDILHKILILFLICGVITALVFLSVFWRALHSLDQVNEGVNAIAEGNYEKKLCLHTNDDLQSLAESVNTIAYEVGKNVNSLQEITKVQERFVQNFSHEMKTPLASILCYTELMKKEGTSEEERRQFGRVLEKEVKRLTVISGELREFLTVEMIPEEKKEIVSIQTFMEEVYCSFFPILQHSHITLNMNIEEFKVFVDKELFRAMIYNYLDNARKASVANSKIDVNAYQTKDFDVIEIKDYGIGIPENEIEKIEEPFYMVDKARTRKDDSVGLGLALCKKIANAHDIKVDILSRQNKGTVIRLEFAHEKE